MKAFTIQEMETIYNLGAMVRGMVDDYEIEFADSKDVFYYALGLAMQFEALHPDTENYHNDLHNFAYDKLIERYGFEC